eukprot:CAMPEP_0114985762 /NCGR_PEP_ID=MMETSP0216-20121206/8050_1 /TAXON_ID=223996 /ORGANISM="Protocruzia adherens, Strain Boccale" /LENGTH=739 /DNA_ID=CAMNT_0002348121 /DNA_START=37 /DNA_END=2256 /DNA_ORIENTATION=+
MADATEDVNAVIEEGQLPEENADDVEQGDNVDQGDADGHDEDNETKEFALKDFVSQPYKSENVEDTVNEIEMGLVKSSRPLIRMKISRRRAEFQSFDMGGKLFTDKNVSDGYLETKHQSDANFNLKKKTLEMGFQAANPVAETASQTTWNRMVNSAIQCDVIEDLRRKTDFDQKVSQNDELDEFLREVAVRVEEALQSNETMNVFEDEFAKLGDDDEAGGSGKQSTNFVEVRNFHKLEYCKGRRVTCIKFEPGQDYVIAASFVENNTFEQRVDKSGKDIPSSILIYKFEDLHVMEPQFILISPVEINRFEFNPQDTNIIVGGCLNGQIIVWDLAEAKEKLAEKKSKAKRRQRDFNKMDKGQDEDDLIIKHKFLSPIAESHKSAVVSLQWMPEKMELKAKGQITQKQSKSTRNFLSLSQDGTIHFWDIRHQEKGASEATMKSIFAVAGMMRKDGTGDMGGSHLLFEKEQFGPTFRMATDQGEVCLIDWSVRGTADENSRPEFIKELYDNERSYRPVIGFQKSPFYDDIYLVIHDFHFSVFKWGIPDPIFTSAYTQGEQLTCGCFSETRPGVILIGKSDGKVDVWDLTDQSHKCSFNYPACTYMITEMAYQTHYLINKEQLLAFGDINGNIHILVVPKNISKKLDREEKMIGMYWEREVARVNFRKEREEARELERQQLEMEEQMAEYSKGLPDKKDEDPKLKEELKAEEEYQEMLRKHMEALGLIEPTDASPEKKDGLRR